MLQVHYPDPDVKKAASIGGNTPMARQVMQSYLLKNAEVERGDG